MSRSSIRILQRSDYACVLLLSLIAVQPRMLDFGQFDFGQFDFGQFDFGQLQTGPLGFAHDSPRTPNVHISRPRRFKHHQNSTQKPQERERRRKLWRKSEKKKREILGPPPFGAPPFGAHFFLGLGPPPFGPPPFGAPPFWAFGAPPFGAPFFGAPLFLWLPKFNIQKLAEVELAEVEIGRSRNWPKSKLAEVELAELEKKSWPKSITPSAAWASNRGSEHVDVLLNDSLPLDSCSIERQRRDWSGVHSSFWSIQCPPSTLQSRCQLLLCPICPKVPVSEFREFRTHRLHSR